MHECSVYSYVVSRYFKLSNLKSYILSRCTISRIFDVEGEEWWVQQYSRERREKERQFTEHPNLERFVLEEGRQRSQGIYRDEVKLEGYERFDNE